MEMFEVESCVRGHHHGYARVGVTYYIMRENLNWREFNLAIFYDSPNRQIIVLARLYGMHAQFSCSA